MIWCWIPKGQVPTKQCMARWAGINESKFAARVVPQHNTITRPAERSTSEPSKPSPPNGELHEQTTPYLLNHNSIKPSAVLTEARVSLNREAAFRVFGLRKNPHKFQVYDPTEEVLTA